MKTNIKTTNIELTDALREFVDEKLTHIEKFLDPADETVMCDVEIGTSSTHHQSGDIFKAEIDLTASGSHFRATAEKEDLYVAMNEAKEDIVQAVNSYRDKLQKKERKGGAALKNILKGFKGE